MLTPRVLFEMWLIIALVPLIRSDSSRGVATRCPEERMKTVVRMTTTAIITACRRKEFMKAMVYMWSCELVVRRLRRQWVQLQDSSARLDLVSEATSSGHRARTKGLQSIQDHQSDNLVVSTLAMLMIFDRLLLRTWRSTYCMSTSRSKEYASYFISNSRLSSCTMRCHARISLSLSRGHEQMRSK